MGFWYFIASRIKPKAHLGICRPYRFNFHSHAWGCDGECPCFVCDEDISDVDFKVAFTFWVMDDRNRIMYNVTFRIWVGLDLLFYTCWFSCRPMATFFAQFDVDSGEVWHILGYNPACAKWSSKDYYSDSAIHDRPLLARLPFGMWSSLFYSSSVF